MLPDNDLRGRLALVTGASGGIGAACARALANAGCSLALTYSSNADSVQRLQEELAANAEKHTHDGIFQQITIHRADLSSLEETQALCDEVRKEQGFRTIDVLVSNAGYGKRIRNIWDIPVEEFDKVHNINTRAAFVLYKDVVNGMREQRWGRIVFVSSIAAQGGGMNGCHYAASKGGLNGLMRNLATTLAPYNITANDVAPAMVESTGMIPTADHVPGLKDSIPLKRLCTPEEVANAVLMFATTGYVTGQSLLMSGGLK